MPLKVRVSKVNLSDQEFVDFILALTTNPDNCIIVKEHTPKDHYHVYLEDCYSAPTVRDRLQKVCPTKGNDSYSVSDKHTDWLGYKGYLVKYENTTILHCKFDIEELREYYESQKCKSSKFKKRTEFTKILNFVTAKMDADSADPGPRNITKLILQFYIEEQKIFNKAHIGQILNTIWYLLHPEDDSYIELVLEEANIRSQYGKRVVTKSTTYFQDARE